MQSLKKFVFVLLALAALGAYWPAGALTPATAEAWGAKKARRDSGEKPLTHKQAKALAAKLTAQLTSKPFFRKPELPRKVSIALIPIKVARREVTDKEFTNLVLNDLLNKPEVSIVNQDPQLSNDQLDFSLMSYDTEWLARQRGLMLGANYIISGAVTESMETDDKGRVYRVYAGELAVKNISTGRVVAETKVYQNRKKVARKRRD